jgi:hypothetical protein
VLAPYALDRHLGLLSHTTYVLSSRSSPPDALCKDVYTLAETLADAENVALQVSPQECLRNS